MPGRVATRTEKHILSRRRARWVGLAGFLAAAATPALLWHSSMSAIASDFRLEVEYLVTGWTGYALIGLGLIFFVPVLTSIGRHPESRLYPRSRNAYAGWGVSLYLLGVILASQVAAVTGLHPTP
ncbi:MAG TPA: hypothetical protein VK304_00605 [Thermoleophilaceae bacterium]|nr:hypothetical protein [Thermoleophilaceae bacterium]